MSPGLDLVQSILCCLSALTKLMLPWRALAFRKKALDSTPSARIVEHASGNISFVSADRQLKMIELNLRCMVFICLIFCLVNFC